MWGGILNDYLYRCLPDNVARMQINRLSVCKNKDNNIHCSDLLKKSFREDLGKMLC